MVPDVTTVFTLSDAYFNQGRTLALTSISSWGADSVHCISGRYARCWIAAGGKSGSGQLAWRSDTQSGSDSVGAGARTHGGSEVVFHSTTGWARGRVSVLCRYRHQPDDRDGHKKRDQVAHGRAILSDPVFLVKQILSSNRS